MSFHEQKSIVIDRPIQAVWDYVLENDEWRRPMVLDVNKLTDGPPKPGTRYEDQVDMMGNKMSIVNEIIEIDPPTYLSWKQVSEEGPMTTILGSYTLEPLNGKTRFTLGAEYELKGLAKLITPIMRWQVRNKIYPNLLEQLKETLENQGSE